jgi:hypothetical protein
VRAANRSGGAIINLLLPDGSVEMINEFKNQKTEDDAPFNRLIIQCYKCC